MLKAEKIGLRTSSVLSILPQFTGREKLHEGLIEHGNEHRLTRF